MEPVEILPLLLSLDVTAGLVAQGARAPWRAGTNIGDAAVTTLQVLDASNTSPIIVTIPTNSLTVSDAAIGVRAGSVLHIVIAGVTGNTAANKVDPVTLRNEAWHAVVLTPTTLALYDLNPETGALVASTGNGAYAGGGTVSKALIDGLILLGREYIGETSAAPRIVMVPKGAMFGPPNASSPRTAVAIADGEPDREDIYRPLHTETILYDVHVWGAGGSTSQAHFSPVQRMYRQVLRSAFSRCQGVYEATGSGLWIDQHEGAPQRLKYGHEFTFTLGLMSTITDLPPDLTAPEPLDLDATITLEIPT